MRRDLATRAARWQFALAVALICLLLMIWPQALPALMWERGALGDGQFWRWISGHGVHLNASHGASNLLGLLLICESLWDELRLGEAWLLVLWTAAGISLLMWCFSPQIQWYAGLSGVLHGLWAGCALAWFCRTRDRIAALALLLLACKLAFPAQALTAQPVVSDAHRYGALCGGCWALLRMAERRLRFFG